MAASAFPALSSAEPGPTIRPATSSSESVYSIAEPLSLQPRKFVVTSSNLLCRFLFFTNFFSSSIFSGSRVLLNDESTSWKSLSESELISLYDGTVFFLHSLYGRLSARFAH